MTLASTKAKKKYNKKAYTQITLRIRKDEQPMAVKIAKEDGLTLNGMINEALREYYKRKLEGNRNKKILTLNEIKDAVLEMTIKRPDIGIELVFLFGSYARGEANGESDLDLCIMLEDKFSMKKRGLIQKEIFEITGKRASIIDAEGEYDNPFFLENLEKEMILLYEKDHTGEYD